MVEAQTLHLVNGIVEILHTVSGLLNCKNKNADGFQQKNVITIELSESQAYPMIRRNREKTISTDGSLLIIFYPGAWGGDEKTPQSITLIISRMAKARKLKFCTLE